MKKPAPIVQKAHMQSPDGSKVEGFSVTYFVPSFVPQQIFFHTQEEVEAFIKEQSKVLR